MNFTKMNGAGNDFVITDNRITKTNFTPKTIAKLCDRNRGIGADGFMSVESPENDGDYRMRYYNCLLYTSPSPRDGLLSRMPSSA